MSKKAVLMILDGWGIGNKSKADATHQAKTTFIDSCYDKYPHSQLLTHGENVGLPEGQMGNSEVGHLNLGAGRIVYQDLVRINKAIKENTLGENQVLQNAFRKSKETGCSLHFMGLVSTGGVHSHQKHLHHMCDLASDYGLQNVFVHAFTDGRDRDPNSGKQHISDLLSHLKNTSAELVSLVGRYYAMDRDNRWERIKKAYDLLVAGIGEKSTDLLESVEKSYANNITDEFIEPVVKVNKTGNAIGRIKPNDVVICFNFRTDRCREITMALTQQNVPEYEIQTLPLHYVTMTNYDNTFKGIEVLFHKDNLEMTLGEVLEQAGKSQLRIAETEKYPHVTFFFSGGREKEFAQEKRIMVASPKVATYDLQPEMSAKKVTEELCNELTKTQPDFVCLNFANPDMVGHTGNFEAVIKAIETTDNCAKKVVETGLKNGYSFIIIADHGNSEYMINDDGSPNTAHTTNPVPCILISTEHQQVNNGILADVAPTILQLLGVSQPKQMTGKSLVS